MRLATLAPLFFILLASFLLALLMIISNQDENGHVVQLDSNNFNVVVKNYSFIVVKFYTPWCAHCQRFAPEYKMAAMLMKSNDPPIVLAEVDVHQDKNKRLANEFGIQSFPTLKIFENQGNVVRDYKGPMVGGGIVSYLRKQVGPPSEEITSLDEGLKILEDNQIVVVGIFSSYASEEFKNFTSLATQLRSNYEFRHTLDANLLPEKATKFTTPSIHVFKNYDNGYNHSMNFEVEAMKSFLDEVSLPFVVLFNNDPTQRTYLSRLFANLEYSKVFLFLDARDESMMGVRVVYEELAKQYRREGLRFIIADTKDAMDIIKHFGVKIQNLPTILVHVNDEKKYIYEKVTSGKINQWLKNVTENRVSKYYKSEPIPQKNDDHVKVVVHKTFESMVLNSRKNVLVVFYAPWCGHCQELMPILEDVAITFKSQPDIMVAKFDATSNDIKHKQFKVIGFPTLYMHSSSGKLVSYEGDRSKKDLIKFINVNKEYISHVTTINEEDREEIANDEL